MTKNKKVYKNIFYSLILLLNISCNDYLSETPDNRTIINSSDKISQLIASAYPDQDYLLMSEIMSDNADDKGNINQTEDLELALYTWNTSNLEERGSPANYWNACYEAIAQANLALQSIKKLNPRQSIITLGRTVTVDGNSDSSLNAQQGEALLARAYSHFMLVNFWAKHYDPKSAKTDLGIPYVTETEDILIKKYTRKTVQEVYDLIEFDLLVGLHLVGNDYKEPKFHFTKQSGYAFATRFYTYKAEWSEVLYYSSKIITNPDSQGRDMVYYAGLSLTEKRAQYTDSKENANLLISSPESLWNRRHRSSRFGLSVDKIRETLFGEDSNPLDKEWAYELFRSNSESYFTPKFQEYFRYTNAGAGIGIPHVATVLFDIDEVILNRAEALAMSGLISESASLLNSYLSKKIDDDNYVPTTDILDESIIQAKYPVIAEEYTPFYDLTNMQTSIIKAISEFKRRQFYHEGLRWFDIRRFGLSITHEIDNGTDVVLEKNDPRKQLQIPAFAISAGLKENIR